MNRRRRHGPLATVTVIASCLLAILGSAAYWLNWTFERNCTDHLKMAADAGDIVTAKERIDKAIAYLEKNNLTKGHTWIFFETPTCEIEPWYANLKRTQQHLATFPREASESDKYNTLMKLREVILDHAKDGDHVTVPYRISLYPHNAPFFWGEHAVRMRLLDCSDHSRLI